MILPRQNKADMNHCYTEPNQPAVGVQTVFVNGEPIVKAGKLLTDAAPDQPIRRAVRQ